MSTLDSPPDVSLHHVLTVILIVAPLGSILLPVIGVLLFFTPTESRRRPVFLLNVLACFLGICQAIYFTSLNSYVVLHPIKPISHSTAIGAIAILLAPPILVDSILLFRLLAFYPIPLTPRNTILAILTPTFLCKVARLACLIAFLVTYPVARLDGPSYATLPELVWGRGPWIIALLSLQAIDNTYVSSLFLYKLYRFGYTTQKAPGGSRSKHVAIIERLSRLTEAFQEDIFSRVPAVFFITLGNYVVPVTIDIVLIVLMISLPSWSSGAYILYVANFIAILGIVFATVWTTNLNWIMRRMVESGADTHTQSTMRFQAKSIADAFTMYDPYGSPEYFSPTL